MTKRMITAQLSVGALLLVLVALMESYTGWDTAAQRLWFDSATHEWVVSNELHARLTWFFYDGPKILLVVLGIACVAGVLGGARWNLPPECRRGCLLLLLSLAPSRSRSSGANTSIRACWNAGTPPMKAVPPAGVSRRGTLRAVLRS